jgi:hypothetical protein
VTIKKVQRALLKAVGQRIAASGFESRPVGQSFLRRSPLGRDAFHLSFIEHPADFDVVADVGVRIDDLEDLVNENDTLLSKEKKQTYSLGAELGNISGQGQQRWTVTSSADVTPVADEIMASFNSIGLAYLDKASTMEGAYRLLTSPGRGAWLHSPIHASRAKRVIGLAKIMGRPDELAKRANENIQLLEGLNDAQLPDFRRFVDRLGVKV